MSDDLNDDLRLRSGNVTKAQEIIDAYQCGDDRPLSIGWAVRFAAQIVADAERQKPFLRCAKCQWERFCGKVNPCALRELDIPVAKGTGK